MNPPVDDNELEPVKLEEEKEGGPSVHCDLYDTDIVYKIAQELLPGLASACIDNTTGGLLKSPASVAVDIRREMVDYLIQRSENFLAESAIESGVNEEISENPYDILSDLIDDFSSSKRNFFSRVSGWLLSEKREDWIDDLVQEMEINGFWLLNRRESVAQTLLKNVDFKNKYHCGKSFKSVDDLEVHKSHCSFRTMTCTNEGCNSRFSAAQMDHHDSSCPFKILPCEQNCTDRIMRRQMDRHCITICPMKLVKCPFYAIGCHSTIPQCTIDQHRSEGLHSHVLYILQALHGEGLAEILKERAEDVVKLSSPEQLASARDARALTFVVKDRDTKLGPLKVEVNSNRSEYLTDSTDKPIKNDGLEEFTEREEKQIMSPSKCSDPDDSSHKKETSGNSPAKVSAQIESKPSQENLNESPREGKWDIHSPTEVEEQTRTSSIAAVVDPDTEEHTTLPIKKEDLSESIHDREKHESANQNEEFD
ncbi:hypothetical protein F511_23641 [Dorcoceras hygrometricum]|uniref:TRAF-type domain-containing protein n=1 Tax=Dorcoceras hygrometricum TaxID=472368 RepID=A0A2Z7BPR3_9LAMI|nr:hypothetical protein F511_23641 [Dorcoceras hygrometricum]